MWQQSNPKRYFFIHKFLGLPDPEPDPLVGGKDPDVLSRLE